MVPALMPCLGGSDQLADVGGNTGRADPTHPLLDWPPPFRFDQTSIQALARGTNDNREDVTMEVA
ncbi:hypothetical protein OG588_26805 [Streptomyces prunicolor]|uniref:hypothetical protein n=1 Tax=Streptomyces prunicolor TaxID=67348 RepID=UPI0038688CE1|nr:hypothetical protein OG588_26805 [Streptomyces prunicolor]